MTKNPNAYTSAVPNGDSENPYHLRAIGAAAGAILLLASCTGETSPDGSAQPDVAVSQPAGPEQSLAPTLDVPEVVVREVQCWKHPHEFNVTMAIDGKVPVANRIDLVKTRPDGQTGIVNQILFITWPKKGISLDVRPVNQKIEEQQWTIGQLQAAGNETVYNNKEEIVRYPARVNDKPNDEATFSIKCIGKNSLEKVPLQPVSRLEQASFSSKK